MKAWLRPSLDWLIVFLPVAIALKHFQPESRTLIFAAACLAIPPLAGWLGRATEQIAARTSEAVGGLLNATFGNAAELIIALAALQRGLYGVVKASLTGSIVGNLLLVAGMALFCGGLRFKAQKFRAVAVRSQATMLLLAAVSLIVPAAFHLIAGPAARAVERDLSLEMAGVLLVLYCASLVFTLRTHKHLFAGETEEEHEEHAWKFRTAIAVLCGATVLVAWASEILAGSVEKAAESLGMTNVFVGVIVVAVVGNAAEHSTAIFAALKNRMDLSLGIAIGSSIQIALFVAPVLVITSHLLGPRTMDLVFTSPEVLAVVLAVLVTNQVVSDGESNWLEGAMMLAVYGILALALYFLPEELPHANALGAPVQSPLH
jgi:Ca2+:H+ antiporter